jgi:hypothetical protein
MRNFIAITVLLVPIIFFSFCTKKVTAPPPAPVPKAHPQSVQISKDISFCTFLLSDVMMMCGYGMGNDWMGHHYRGINSSIGYTNSVYWTQKNETIITFDYENLTGMDNRRRSGALEFKCTEDPPRNRIPAVANPLYYDEYDFVGYCRFTQFVVGEWMVQNLDTTKPATIVNLRTLPLILTENIRWELTGKFRFTHMTDPTRSLMMEGSLVKTLLNTADTAVYSMSRLTPIRWGRAQILFEGNLTGIVNDSESVVYKIKEPLQRDFTCHPHPVSGPSASYEFTKGTAALNIPGYSEVSIDFGASAGCDRKGRVAFEGETHSVDFD